MREYREGQVWEYRTRRGEEDSRLLIQRIEVDAETGELIFHVSITGLKWPTTDKLAHAPVSGQTLEQSLTRLAEWQGPFPSADEGITTWREARGGVYSISLAEIIQAGDVPLR